MFTDATLRDVLDRTDIVELVREYVELKRSGNSFAGLCPFHNEKTPSFYVNPGKQLFKCFGCQKGGSAFSFVQALEGWSFPEAVRALAERAGVEIREEENRRSRPKNEPPPKHQRLFEANAWAAKYFHYLLTEVKESASTRAYLKSRGVSEKTAKRFQIGLAPKGWNTLIGLMAKRGYSLHEMVEAGLVVEKQGSPSGGYDRFRERLMFPIRDRDGNVVGFGGRQLTDDPKQPKYMNTPESPLFSKRRLLYGIHENQRGIRVRGEVLVVEGYMDVVGLAEAGVNNAVASMGTALTESHCSLIRSLTRNVITVFDSDEAGSEAWHRSVHMLMEAGIFAKDLSLPKGMDPDEFVLANGADTFYESCRKAPQQVTKMLREIAARGALSEAESSEILEKLTPILVASRNLPDRALFWDNLSLVLGVSQESLRDLAREGYKRRRPAERGQAPVEPAARRPEPPRAPPGALDKALFRAALRRPEDFGALDTRLWSGAVKDPDVKSWLEELFGTQDPLPFQEKLQLLTQQRPSGWCAEQATGVIMALTPGESEEEDNFEALVQRLEGIGKEKEVHRLTAEIKLSQRLGDTERQLQLLEQLTSLRST